MSEIIGLVGMSHSPFATMTPPHGPEQPGGRVMADAARVAQAVTTLAPDAVVVIGPDHFHANFYDVMPPFVIGVEEAVGFGDFGSASGPIPVAGELAWSVHAGLADAGFDLAVSYSLTVDRVMGFLRDVCEPYIRIFRRLLPMAGPLDLSPMFALLTLWVINVVVVQGIIHG